ncbi:leucyl-tRNA synthetase [Saccharata proteae CBS 121410]|uniref:leucine--tRNA ligase n=1 Tax=Saccharata proteae CBS 121410 TaxID=1314787 RepID=A0A9P4HP70_9PEZI|nr:leucyl-tRNA synthetase [Saccharata proteae CBS 121410]
MKRLGLQAAGFGWSTRPLVRARACNVARRVASSKRESTRDNDILDYAALDAKWRARWAELDSQPKKLTGESSASKEKAYVLPMFPYPSGTLHLGHLRVYTISDVLARFKRLQGYEVIHPMGWDAFGLPAENAAIERGIDPAEWTTSNIAKMKEQLSVMNGHWDWSRELTTCDPSFYKHTQRIFLLLHERGLAYQDESLVNFDPVDKTVLANEQVDANGFSWRSGAKVEKIRLRQWFLRITAFKEALLKDLEVLANNERWPERVISMQKNWLGKSEGSKFRFHIDSAIPEKSFAPVEVFTTRADTLFGVQYVALSLNHEIVQDMATKNPELQAFIDAAPGLRLDSKVGFLLPGITATNPVAAFGGVTTKVQEPLPVYAAPYVLDDYGSGAVMGVPAHDARDHAFWRENQGSKPILSVVAPADDQAFVHKGVLTMASGPLCGLASNEASQKIVDMLQQDGEYAEIVDNWRLRDWLISRQRYWGTPIPIVHCDSCGAVPVPESDLPIALPKLKAGQLKGKGGNPLEDIPEWVNTTCPKCKSPAKRETDTMDTFMDSSWYFFRFADPQNDAAPVSAAAADASLPVDVYVGGVEHAILHLLYARFISKFLATTPLWPSGGGPDNKGEPFKKLLTQGMVHGKTYSDPATGRFLKPEEVDLSNPSSPKIIQTGEKPNISFEKMSKSKYNGVDPARCIELNGADTTRAHMLFQAPVSEVLEWDEERIVGMKRWLGRVLRVMSAARAHFDSPPQNLSWHVEEEVEKRSEAADLYLSMHQTIKSVTTSLDSTYSLNTIISDLIKLTNVLNDIGVCPKKDKTLTLNSSFPFTVYAAASHLCSLLAPIAPAVAEESHSILNGNQSDKTQKVIDKLSSRSQTCAVQVNGKLKFAVQIPVPDTNLLEKERLTDLTNWAVEQVIATEQGRKWFGEGGNLSLKDDVKKIIVVKGGQTINFVQPKRMKESQ